MTAHATHRLERDSAPVAEVQDSLPPGDPTDTARRGPSTRTSHLGSLVDSLRRSERSARTRILASYIVLLALATAISFVGIRQLMIVRLDDRISNSLVQETEEFRKLVGGTDPRTGRPFGSNVAALFDVYLARNVPDENEELLTFVDGRPYRFARSEDTTYFLERDASLVRHWSSLTQPEEDDVATPAGTVRYIAVPLETGGRVLGSFVVAKYIGDERAEVDEAVRIAGVVAAGVLLIVSMVGFFIAGRVLAPLRDLTETARQITETDLTRRLQVEGDDEIAELGRTFNGMLDRLEAAFSSQREFVRDAGHELRTPITIIRGHLELLGEDPAERRETVELVCDELDRMSRFVEDLLLLAKAERPDFLQSETVDLAALSNELLAKARGLAARDWRLEKVSAGVVVADRQRLTEAVMNLAHNAVQHTSEGDEIVLGTSTNGTLARLWVGDKGPGIDPSEQATIFDRFARGGGSGGRYGGTGLGLAIVRAIAEAHRGRVELDSRPGEGARFTIAIPVEEPREVSV